MNPTLPVVDDKKIWDTWTSFLNLPAITVSLELGIFEALASKPATAETIASKLKLSERGTAAILGMLTALDYTERRNGVFQITVLGKQYMLQDSPFFWGKFFSRYSEMTITHNLIRDSLQQSTGPAEIEMPAEGWESGHIDEEMARSVTEFMNCHSIAAAVGMTQTCDFSQVNKMLDVGGGSGCFSIAFASAFPQLHCTIMDLPTICTVADEYIAAAKINHKVNTQAVDMFRQAWPENYDAHFFANVFHDWNFETCVEIAALSFASMPSGGTIYLHEMLLDDCGTAPLATAAFSLLMAMGTKGQQFTFSQLAEILSAVGFVDINSQNSYGYYSLVSATKP